MPDPDYVHPQLLAETQWLAERLDRPDIRIVDMGPRESYERAHIPGAVSIGRGDKANYVKDPGNGLHVMQPEQAAALMSGLGVGPDTLVVAYDSTGGHTAARLWWMLTYYGHTRFKLLNGGINKMDSGGAPGLHRRAFVCPGDVHPARPRRAHRPTR